VRGGDLEHRDDAGPDELSGEARPDGEHRRADTGNIQLNATAHTTLPFWLEFLLTLRSDGPGATAAQFMVQARLTA
jgi:hypothetical protein